MESLVLSSIIFLDCLVKSKRKKTLLLIRFNRKEGEKKKGGRKEGAKKRALHKKKEKRGRFQKKKKEGERGRE